MSVPAVGPSRSRPRAFFGSPDSREAVTVPTRRLSASTFRRSPRSGGSTTDPFEAIALSTKPADGSVYPGARVRERMTGTRIGIVGLDTSHPPAFADYLHTETDATVAAVWDGGDVREEAFVDSFCEEYGADRYDDPQGMIDAVDAAMVLTVDWDAHRELAVPFLAADVPTFVDKPLVGRVADAEAIAAAASETPLFGGSAIPFHPKLADVPTGHTRTLSAAGYNDPFYYGVHLTDTVRRLVGDDWSAVEPAPGPRTVAIRFEDGSTATLRLEGPPEDGDFGLLDVAERTRARLLDGDPDAHREMYGRFLDTFLERVREGGTDRDRLVDAARLLLATRAVLERGERVVPDSDALERVHADGRAFRDDYTPP
jgi:predicted dehydrogenase